MPAASRNVSVAAGAGSREDLGVPRVTGQGPVHPFDGLVKAPLAVAQGLGEGMAQADLAISGGGQTLYELAALGLPAVAVCVASTQEANLAALAAAPTLVALRRPGAGETDWGALRDAVHRLAADVDGRARMSAAGRALVDGCGASRAADGILALGRMRP